MAFNKGDMSKEKNLLQGNIFYKIDGDTLSRLEVFLFKLLIIIQILWLFIESIFTPIIVRIFAFKGIDFELVRRFGKTKRYSQELIITKLVDAFNDASEIYMALGEMGHGLMERPDVLNAFMNARQNNNATIQILHGPRVDPETSEIFNLASENIVELYRTQQYYNHHFSYVKDKNGKITVFDEGIHDETIWGTNELGDTIPFFTSLARHQYLISKSNRLHKSLKAAFDDRKLSAKKVYTRPDKFVPSDYSPLRIFLTSTFINVPFRHIIQPLQNFLDMPLEIIKYDTRKNQDIKMNNKLKWIKRLSTRHYGWLIIFSLIWIFGLSDLLMYIFTGQSIIHWFNDILLMFGSVSLTITIIMVLIEESG